VLTLKGKIQFI